VKLGDAPGGPNWQGERMRRTLLFVLALLVVGFALPACGGEADKALTPFQGEGFTISMPGKPERSSQTTPTAAGELTIVLYTSQSSDEAYTVGYTDIPGGAEADLADVIQGSASSVKGTASDEVDSTYQGFRARDARISNASDDKGNKATVFLRALLAGDRLYQLQYLQKGADVKTAPAEYAEFLASLKIG